MLTPSYLAVNCLGLLAAIGLIVHFVIRTHQRPITVELILVGWVTLLYIVPKAADLVFGLPSYPWASLRLASASSVVSAIYWTYILSTLGVISWFGIRQARRATLPWKVQSVLPSSARSAILWVLLILPVAIVLGSPDPLAYRSYGSIISERTNAGLFASGSPAQEFHVFVSKSTLGAILAGCWLTLSARHSQVQSMALRVAPFLGFAVWVNGKRFILAVLVISATFVWFKVQGRLLTARQLWIGAAAVVLFFFASLGYQRSFRGLESASAEKVYTNIRLDWGRDHLLYYALSAELASEDTILEYRASSFIGYFQYPLSLVGLGESPVSYPRQITGAIIQESPATLKWGLTTSILDESVANFSWFGVIVTPALIGSALALMHRRESDSAALLTLVFLVMILSLHLLSVLVPAILWCTAVLLNVGQNAGLKRSVQRERQIAC